MSIRIYVEGGFDASTKSKCRKAFRVFLEKIVIPGSFKVIASGSRSEAFKDFCLALRQHPEDFVLLLVDSESTVTANPWQHLNAREGDKWVRPQGANDEQVHLMVQVMESWFLADKNALSEYYGHEFLRNSMPAQKNIENIDKEQVFKILEHASRPTQKGLYRKTRHGFDLLELINPNFVAESSSHANRLFNVLKNEAKD